MAQHIELHKHHDGTYRLKKSKSIVYRCIKRVFEGYYTWRMMRDDNVWRNWEAW